MNKTVPLSWLSSALALSAMLCAVPARADVEHLLPKVKELRLTDGPGLSLARPLVVNDPTATPALTSLLAERGATFADTGTPVTVELVSEIPGAFRHNLEGFPDEEYSFSVTPEGITVRAVSQAGVIRAAQTLSQLAMERDASLPCVEITDWPAFKLRGYMHDVGRSFISVESLKRHIDELARFKVNVFFWHLTENQAWRFEVKQYPQLTSAESMIRYAGDYYTQEQCREVVAYAKERGITVIPEIDMPGHSAAFERAMGFAMMTDRGVEVLKRVLDETVEVFPDAPYIHIGADETHVTADFINTMVNYLRDNLGRKAIVWNPMANGMNIDQFPNIDMTAVWRHGQKAAGKKNVDMKFKYLNLTDCFADLFGLWRGQIYREDRGTDEVSGAATAVWNDRKLPTEEDITVQNNMFAATIALAERAWMGGGYGYLDQTGVNLPVSGEIYDGFVDWENRFLYHKNTTLVAEKIPYVRQTNIRWRIVDPIPNGGNTAAVLAPEKQEELSSSYTVNGVTYGSQPAAGAAVYLWHTWHESNISVPALFGQRPNHTAYAYTYVYSPVEQDAGALIEFHNYGRSEDDLSPFENKWDRKDSQVWLNGEAIPAPTWVNPTYKGSQSMERDLGNENFTARRPAAIHLNEGWNKLLLRLPFKTENAANIRLDHWYFTFAITDADGRDALPGLIYSPEKSLDPNAGAIIAAVDAARRRIDTNIVNGRKQVIR